MVFDVSFDWNARTLFLKCPKAEEHISIILVALVCMWEGISVFISSAFLFRLLVCTLLCFRVAIWALETSL